MRNRPKQHFQVLSIAVIVLLGILSLTFFYLYVNANDGFLYDNRLILNICATVIISILTAVAIIFQLNDNTFVYRLTLLTLLTATFALLVLYLMQISGFWDRIDSISDLRTFISEAGSFATILYIIMHILQVVILPIPGVVAVGAGVALFGPLKAALLSIVGVMSGSLIAFFIGRVFGYKAAKWLVGDGLDKALKAVKGKDKVILTFMFIFPFFPDDILCFVAGISSMSTKYFLIMITITRTISIFLTAYSFNGNIIPYNTWWGLMLWGIIIALTIALTIYIYKYGDKIEKFFIKKFSKKEK